jgi:hypothetical protein
MKHVILLSLGCASLALMAADRATQTPAADRRLAFSCTAFAPNVSEADLRARFGAEHVQTALVPWGGAEGDYNEGTVLFGKDSDAKLEIFWQDRAQKRHPGWVSVRGDRSSWRTPAGIAIGTGLRALEGLNGRPFRLVGFGSDVSGTVMSWSDGRLTAQDTTECRVRLRLRVAWETTQDGRSPQYRQLQQLMGEREFSSGHPAMQALNPSVYELFLQYR